MAGTIVTTVKARKGQGIVRLKATLTCDGSGVVTAAPIGSAFGRIVAIGYTPGTIATGGDITITDTDSGAALVTLTDAGVSNRWFRPTGVVTDNAGVAVTAATTAVDLNRDVYVAGKISVAVAQGGAAGAGALTIIVQEG